MRSRKNLIFKSDKIDPFWNGRFIWFSDLAKVRPVVGETMLGALREAVDLVHEFYQLDAPVYPDMLQITKWDTQMFMPPHADNAHLDGSTHKMAHRDFAGIIYLNDSFEGGELYFTALDIAIKPKRGRFVGFTAGFHHEHSVVRIKSGTRLTMPFFLTFDRSKAAPGLARGL